MEPSDGSRALLRATEQFIAETLWGWICPEPFSHSPLTERKLESSSSHGDHLNGPFG